MVFVWSMWIVWGVFVVLTAGLHIYRGSLEKDEEDQIFLDDSFQHEQAEQAAIVARVNKVEPFVRVSYWLVASMSVVVIAYYVHDFGHQLGIFP